MDACGIAIEICCTAHSVIVRSNTLEAAPRVITVGEEKADTVLAFGVVGMRRRDGIGGVH